MKTKKELNELKEEIECLNKRLNELNEEELMIVTGGTGRSRTMIINVKLPSNTDVSSSLDVYVDGIRDASESDLLPPGLEEVNITVRGAGGCVHVEVRINNVTYKEYSVDFDERRITEL